MTHLRPVQILNQLQRSTFRTDFYQPGTLEVNNRLANYRYSGSIQSLQLSYKVSQPVSLVLALVDADDREFVLNNPIALTPEATTTLDLLPFLTKEAEFKISPFVTLRLINAQTLNLAFNDSITLTGYAVEEGRPTNLSGGPADTSWGAIGGLLDNQTDLQAALNNKTELGHSHHDFYHTKPEVAGLLANLASAKRILVEDRKASGTDGGSYATGAWLNRILNTIVLAEVAGVSLNGSSDGVNLPAGKYWIEWRTPVYAIGRCNSRLWNQTSGSELIPGQSGFTNDSGQSIYTLQGCGQVTLDQITEIRLQVRGNDSRANSGLGISNGGGFTLGNEIYSSLLFIKV